MTIKKVKISSLHCVNLSDDKYGIEGDVNNGNIYRLKYKFDTGDNAEILIEKIENVDCMINLDHWKYTRTIYGSPAFINGGHELKQLMNELKKDKSE